MSLRDLPRDGYMRVQRFVIEGRADSAKARRESRSQLQQRLRSMRRRCHEGTASVPIFPPIEMQRESPELLRFADPPNRFDPAVGDLPEKHQRHVVILRRRKPRVRREIERPHGSGDRAAQLGTGKCGEK
jgi:hypothetical protein